MLRAPLLLVFRKACPPETSISSNTNALQNNALQPLPSRLSLVLRLFLQHKCDKNRSSKPREIWSTSGRGCGERLPLANGTEKGTATRGVAPR